MVTPARLARATTSATGPSPISAAERVEAGAAFLGVSPARATRQSRFRTDRELIGTLQAKHHKKFMSYGTKTTADEQRSMY